MFLIENETTFFLLFGVYTSESKGYGLQMRQKIDVPLFYG
jgi:hypothetical protein